LYFDIDSSLVNPNALYNISLEVSNNVNYPYRNIWIFVQDNIENDTIFANSSKEYELADEFGKWHGSGFGNLYQISFPLFENVSFKRAGSHRIKLEHGMRDEMLPGIEKVGLRIEEVS